jgi:hypothetical protein
VAYSPGLNNPTAGPIPVTGPLTDAQLRASPVVASISPVVDTPEFFEDTNFVSGDSPVTLDLNAALGRNANTTEVINDGAGNFTVAYSTDGVTFGDAITMKYPERLILDNVSVDSIRITWVADSAYRVIFI